LIFSRLAFTPPELGFRKPGFIHFPASDDFNLEFFKQLIASEVRERRFRAGVPYSVYKQIRDRNEGLDMAVGNLAIRRSLHPRYIAKDGSLAPPAPVSPSTAPMTPVSSSEGNEMKRSAPAEKLSSEWYNHEIAKLLVQFPDLKTPQIEEALKQIAELEDDDDDSNSE
jgi:phage terminase large subunit GpA-like protein